MRSLFGFALAGLIALGAAQSQAQSVLFDFESGGDQGFGNKFSNDASANFPIANIGGSNRMGVLRSGGFQEAERASTGATDPFLLAMNAAAAAPTLYQISYDWYVDTAPGGFGNFLQLGTYINSGQGTFPYTQDFPGAGKDVELNGTQLASGGVFSGTVTETVAAKYGAIHPDFLATPSVRFGLIINGDGPNAIVHFDNIRIAPVIPEPATCGLASIAGLGLLCMRRRK
jgi:hypothetical protein